MHPPGARRPASSFSHDASRSAPDPVSGRSRSRSPTWHVLRASNNRADASSFSQRGAAPRDDAAFETTAEATVAAKSPRRAICVSFRSRGDDGRGPCWLAAYLPGGTAAPLAVLVVEDDEPVRALVRTALEDVARVREAGDADEALTILEERGAREIDVLLVDYRMPRRSGLELLRLVKARWPWLSMIMMTGFGSEELAIQALRAGARDYLKKPLDVKELRRVVAGCARAERPPAARAAPPLRRRRPPPRAPVSGKRWRSSASTSPSRITLSQVAREARLSKFHFCRLFQRRVGMSFREYLCGIRLERAQALLADRELTVTEVAYAIGFNDLSHFDKVFSRIVGMSPTEYRKSIWSLPEQPPPSFSQPSPRPAPRPPLRFRS